MQAETLTPRHTVLTGYVVSFEFYIRHRLQWTRNSAHSGAKENYKFMLWLNPMLDMNQR